MIMRGFPEWSPQSGDVAIPDVVHSDVKQDADNGSILETDYHK